MYNYNLDNDGFVISCGKTNNSITIDTKCPNNYCFFKDDYWTFSCDKCKDSQIELIRKIRDKALKSLDGEYLAAERDGNTSLVLDWESLRQSLKDAPENAEISLVDLTTLDEIQAVTLESVVIVPVSLQDKVNRWLNEQ